MYWFTDLEEQLFTGDPSESYILKHAQRLYNPQQHPQPKISLKWQSVHPATLAPTRKNSQMHATNETMASPQQKEKRMSKEKEQSKRKTHDLPRLPTSVNTSAGSTSPPFSV
jgi:hypothetical protein